MAPIRVRITVMTGSGTGPSSLAGQTLGRYEIREKLAAGELGTVYLARDTAVGAEVALEVLSPEHAIDGDRLRQEVKAAAGLDHWNIAKIYEFVTVGAVSFVVREHVPGRTLRDALQSGPMGGPVALECARQIARALAAGHALGVTHRHLNPGNIVLDEQNRVKLIDFGLTVPRSASNAAFLAPEQLDGRGADARSDIYSFGKVLQEMAGPAAPFAPIVSRATRKSSASRYQLMEDVLTALDRVAAGPEAAARYRGRHLLLAAVGLALGLVAIGWWILGRNGAVSQRPVPLTSDPGLTTEASISADGRSIVYASDRASSGVLNLWTQPVSGGAPSRLTNGADDDYQPSFSPDAASVVFRSEREGGGIYLAAATGGTPQLLVKQGRDPRFSPDGHWIAYWSGDLLEPRGAGVWVIASSGGQPVRIASDFDDARYPLWSSDGRHLLFAGQSDSSRQMRSADWYVARFANGSAEGRATRTAAERLLRMQVFRESRDGFYSGAFAVPEAWTPGQVLFSGRLAPMGKQNSGLPRLLRIPVSPEIMQATGAAREVTSGADWDAHPSVAANGRLVYSRCLLKQEIWSVAADGSGDMQRLADNTGDVRPAVSRDGTRLAYRVPGAAGRSDIHVVEVPGGKQIASIRDGSARDWPVLLSASGDELVYAGGGILRMRLPAGSPERVQGRRWEQATSWSSDGKYLLVQRGWRGLGLLDVTTGRDRELLLRDERFPAVEARFSPDDKWIVFTLLSRPHSQVFVIPLAADAQRIAVTDENVTAGSPAWSVNGNQIYYLSSCQGFRCIWARRLDARSRKPLGEPFAIRHFHHARYSLLGGIDPQSVGLTAAGDRLVFGMFETTGNIWSLPSLPRP
jgi:Tol biopolymer transport system component